MALLAITFFITIEDTLVKELINSLKVIVGRFTSIAATLGSLDSSSLEFLIEVNILEEELNEFFLMNEIKFNTNDFEESEDNLRVSIDMDGIDFIQEVVLFNSFILFKNIIA